MMRVFLDDRRTERQGDLAPVLYVQREQAGALIVHGAGAAYMSERYTLPTAAVELEHPDEIKARTIGEVRTALADVPMSKTARAAVEAKLDKLDGLDELDPEQ